MLCADTTGVKPRAPDDAKSIEFLKGAGSYDWQEFFLRLRESGDVVHVADDVVVVTRWIDVADVLARTREFRVPYFERIQPSVGCFMLARDNEVQNARDKAVMRAILRFDDLPEIRTYAGEVAAGALRFKAAQAGVDRIDLVATVTRLVPLQVVKTKFGFPPADDAEMLAWSKATQTAMFRNILRRVDAQQCSEELGKAMQHVIRSFIVARRPWSEIKEDDTVSRLLRLTDAGLSGFEAQEVVSNICGLLVGSIETISHAIVNATYELLSRDDVRSQALELAASDDTAAFDKYVWEALRFRPIATFMERWAARGTVVAPGTAREFHLTHDSTVFAAVGPAMFDASVFPAEFQPRGSGNLLHFGWGPHECLGRHIAEAIVPETVKQILLLPGIHLLEGDQSRPKGPPGLFPECFEVAIRNVTQAANVSPEHEAVSQYE